MSPGRQSGLREFAPSAVPLSRAPRASFPPFSTPTQGDLEARLAAASAHLFQRLVSDVATRFSTAGPEAVDEAIVDSLRQTAEALRLDGAALWRWQSSDAMAFPTHFWVQPPCAWVPGPMSPDAIPMTGDGLHRTEVCSTTPGDRREDERGFLRGCGFRSVAVVSLPPTGQDGVLAALTFASATRAQEWTPAIMERLRLIAAVASQALARKVSHVALQEAHEELRRLRNQLPSGSVERRIDVRSLRTPATLVSDSAAMRQVFAQVQQVAPTPATVLLLGETGSGKEVMAQAIHDLSPRRQRPMIRVSCAAIPTTLIESELFGRERGAFTGAMTRHLGRFEVAHGSTLFLDEIGDLPLEVQVKLLRVLQERVVERLGSVQSIKVDVRIIAATNRDLEAAVRDRTFREDLFYRLNVFPVVVPPLRDRVEDIPALVWTFVDEFARSFGRTIDSIPKDCMRELQRYPWPGNVRELRNVIERAVIVSTGRQLVAWPPRACQTPMPQTGRTLCELESEHIRAVLESTNWRVRGAGGAADRLGLKPTTLESRMARLGIVRKNPPQAGFAS